MTDLSIPKEVDTSGKIKTVIDGGPVRGQHKFRQGFKFYPKAKLLFGTNMLPVFRDVTGGFFRRFLPVPFNNQFQGKNDIKELGKKIFAEEKNGIFAWALEGLCRLRANNFEFTQVDSVDATKEQFIEQNNPVALFVSEMCYINPEVVGDKFEIYESYFDWAKANGFGVLNRSNFYKNLKQVADFTEKRVRTKDEKKRYIIGIILDGSESIDIYGTANNDADLSGIFD